jgi:Disulphide bond corrector protein DsbC
MSERRGSFGWTAIRRVRFAVLVGPSLCSASLAQVPDGSIPAPTPIVHWAASVKSSAAAKQGARATLEISADVQDGWHVYALTQPPGGPAALRITLDENPVAQAAGAASGTAPQKRHDPSFDLETQFYMHSFALHVPVRVNQQLPVGGRLIPVSVRFQTCSDRECRPPTTVHLSVPINVLADS